MQQLPRTWIFVCALVVWIGATLFGTEAGVLAVIGITVPEDWQAPAFFALLLLSFGIAGLLYLRTEFIRKVGDCLCRYGTGFAPLTFVVYIALLPVVFVRELFRGGSIPDRSPPRSLKVVLQILGAIAFLAALILVVYSNVARYTPPQDLDLNRDVHVTIGDPCDGSRTICLAPPPLGGETSARAYCLVLANGSYCTKTCGSISNCPPGWKCGKATDVEGFTGFDTIGNVCIRP